MHIAPSWRKSAVGLCAAAVALPLAFSTGVAGAAPPPIVKAQAATGPVTPAVGPSAVTRSSGGAFISSVPTLSGPGDQTWNFTVFSPAMGRNVNMQVLVPPGYNLLGGPSYPVLYQLDGLRADPDITDWSRKADTQGFFASKNVLVVQPIGGYGSFYQNWDTRDPGIISQSNSATNPSVSGGQLQWEKFLTAELPGLVNDVFRGNGANAISGLSMGGFSAFSLAAKHSTLYKAAASYSGFPNTQAPLLPEFLKYVLSAESGATNADDMWGADPGTGSWTVNNPTAQANIASLKSQNISLYMSAGTGGNGPYDEPLGFAGLSANYVGALLEVISNYSSQGFNQVAGANGVKVTTDLTNPGVHDWPYWSAEYKQSWPQLAKALNVTPGFAVGGAIAVKWNQLGGAGGVLGNPTSNEIAIPGGAVSHFQFGDIYFSPATGAHQMQGLILAHYLNDLGGPSGFLGFPLTDEYTTPTKPGKYNQFQNGYIYWSPTTNASSVQGLILQAWGQQGYENSRFGFPTSDEFGIPNGRQSNFQGGSIQYIYGQGIVFR